MNAIYVIIGLAFLAIVFKSRIALWIAIANNKTQRCSLPRTHISLTVGKSTGLSMFTDCLYGWAGSISVERTSEDTYKASVNREDHRKGPNDQQGLYVNGWKVSRCRPVTIRKGDSVILRTGYSREKISRIVLDFGSAKAVETLPDAVAA